MWLIIGSRDTPFRFYTPKSGKKKAEESKGHTCKFSCMTCVISYVTSVCQLHWVASPSRLLYSGFCTFCASTCLKIAHHFLFHLGWVHAVGRNTPFRLKKTHLTTITKLKELRKFISWVAWRNEQMCERFEAKQSKKQFSHSQKTNFLYSLSSSVQIRQKYYYSFKCVLPTKHALNSKCKHYINNIGWQLNI